MTDGRWRLMNSAPKDGTDILTFGAVKEEDHKRFKVTAAFVVLRYQNNVWCDAMHNEWVDMTHWRPLKAPTTMADV